MGLSENSVPLNPMVKNHYPVFKWLFHWEYTLFSDKPTWFPFVLYKMAIIGGIPYTLFPRHTHISSTKLNPDRIWNKMCPHGHMATCQWYVGFFVSIFGQMSSRNGTDEHTHTNTYTVYIYIYTIIYCILHIDTHTM